VSGPAAGVNASSQSGAQGCHCPAGQAQGAAAAARWPGAGQATNLASALRCGRRRLAATAPPACLQDAVAPRPAATPATPARCPSYPSLATVLRLLLSAGPPALQHWLLTAVSVGPPVWPICRSALQTLNCCSQRTSCAPRGYCGRRISKPDMSAFGSNTICSTAGPTETEAVWTADCGRLGSHDGRRA
jgi:hypothetical protein